MGVNKINYKGIDYYISANNIYSTEEQLIGTYLNKPLYRKVVVYKLASQAGESNKQTELLIPHGISNLELIITHHIVSKSDTNNTQQYLFPRFDGPGTDITFGSNLTEADSTNLTFTIINDYWVAGRTFNFILEYTKTTDEEVIE